MKLAGMETESSETTGKSRKTAESPGDVSAPNAAETRTARGDTLAWLYAALHIMGPILLALFLAVGIGYGLMYLIFFR
jgi:hypothetical protein